MYPRVYKELPPDRHLRQYIKCYWIFEKEYHEGDFEHVYPDSSYELLYVRDTTYTVEGKAVPQLFMVGQLSKPVDFAAVGTVKMWSVRFYPWGLDAFGKVDGFAGQDWVPADQVLGEKMATELSELFTHVTEETVADTLDSYFLKRLLSRHFSQTFLENATKKLLAEKGNIKVQELAEYCYISQRQLERSIKKATGRSPRDVAARLRFEQTRDAIMHNPDIPMAFLAQEYGYTDQSHLTNDFKKYADMTPTEYAKMFHRLRPQMQDPNNVVFLQDIV